MLSFFPRGVLDKILNLIESVSEGFPFYSSSAGASYNLIDSRTRVYCAYNTGRFGWGLLDIFTVCPFTPLPPSFWKTARYRLKYCLKRPLNPKQPTNQPTNDSQVNTYFPYRWSPATLTFNIYFYLFLYLYITRITINNDTPHLKSPKNQNKTEEPPWDGKQ